jgi:ribose transport system permease protein
MTDTKKARWEAVTPDSGAPRGLAAGRRRFGLPEETGVIVALIVMIVVIGLAKPRFLNPINLFTVLGNTTFQGMLSLGMVFLLAIREIDLSVGWVFNF